MALPFNTTTYTTNLGTVLANRPVTLRMVNKAMESAVVFSDPFGAVLITSPTTNGSGVFTFYGEPGLYSIAIGPYRFQATLGSSFVGMGESDWARVEKTVTQTINIDVLANDPVLHLPVLANATYDMRLFFVGFSEVGNDFRLGFSSPAGSTMDWVLPSGPEPLPVFHNGEETKVDGSAESSVAITGRGYVYTGATAGNVTFRRSMWTAPGSMEIQQGSWMELRRLL